MAWVPWHNGGKAFLGLTLLLLLSLSSSAIAQESSEGVDDGSIECWFCGPDRQCPLNWRDSVDGGGNVTVEKIR